MAASWAPPTLCPRCGSLTSRYTCANNSGDHSDDDDEDKDDDNDGYDEDNEWATAGSDDFESLKL